MLTGPSLLTHAAQISTVIGLQDWSMHRLRVLKRVKDSPNSLKCGLATVLSNSRCMYVLWGLDPFFFFNGACTPMLGKHLSGATG
jgi:hypothetical protein